MLDLIPENIDGICVFNLKRVGPACDPRYCDCGAFAVSLHNLMLQTSLRYVIVDLQDQKDVCDAFVEELLQLWKRTRVPFYFAGVMPHLESILDSYGYLSQEPTYGSAAEASQAFVKSHPEALQTDLSGITFGKSLPVPKSRQAERLEEDES